MSTPFRRIRMALALLLPVCLAVAQAGELEQRFQTQLKRAEGGDAQAMYAVGESYELGMGTASSRADALRWYRAAAEQGHPQGAYQLGYAYYWGKGVTKDRGEAHAWFLRAAEAGNQAAMPYLSKMYALGQGIPQDKEKAELWAQRARIASELRSPPPAPQARPAPSEPEREAPEQTAPRATTPAATAPDRRTAPTTQSRSRPASSRSAAPGKPPARRVIDRLLGSHWLKQGRPALFLPSARTECTDRGTQLDCRSAPRRSSLLGRAYTFRLVAEVVDFSNDEHFSIRYRPQLTAILEAGPGAFGEEGGESISEEQLRERVEREPEQLTCSFQGERLLRCSDAGGQQQDFDGVTPGESDTAVSRLPSDTGRTGVAALPAPQPQPAEPEVPRKSRTAGPPP